MPTNNGYEFNFITFDNIPRNNLDNLVELLKLNPATPESCDEIDEYIDNDNENILLCIHRQKLTLSITKPFIDEINLVKLYIETKKLECTIN